MHTYTQEMAEGVPDDLVFNADEIFAEVGVPTKVLIPPNEKNEIRMSFSNLAHLYNPNDGTYGYVSRI